jgi:hypothetical protein
MAIELQGSNIVLWLSATGSQFKHVVCSISDELDLTAAVSTVKTKCGTFSTTDIPEGTISGNGTVGAATSLAANECSYKDLQGWLLAGTNLYFIFKDLADNGASETAGASVYLDGRCKISSVKVTGQQGNLITFDWTITLTGTLDNTADS